MLSGRIYIWADKRLLVDYLVGARAAGLIVYGVFVASLVGLGVLRGPDIQPSSTGAVILVVAPISVLYLLIRQRLGAWYLFPNRLAWRTMSITVGILLFSSLIIGAAGILQGDYELIGLGQWWKLDALAKLEPVLGPLSVASVATVGTSTLFLTAVKESTNLPALPAADLVSNLRALRDRLAAISRHTIWTTPSTPNSEYPDLKKTLDGALINVGHLVDLVPRGKCRHGLYTRLKHDLGTLLICINKIENAEQKWYDFIGEQNRPALGTNETSWRSSVQRLRKVFRG